MSTWSGIKAWATHLRGEIKALYLAYQHPATPWYAKAWLIGVVSYAISPIDLIPDFIPILGQVDDLILLPMGIWIAVKLVPEQVLAECRAKAVESPAVWGGKKWVTAALIILLWIIALLGTAWIVHRAWLAQ
jgi:uncharacterized membrane protein YkvA (DUF1232 family)